MTEGHSYIATFLGNLAAVKGAPGRVELHGVHWFPESEGIRGVIAAGTKGPCPATPKPCVPRPQGGNVQPETPVAREWDGVLCLGEFIEFTGRSPRDGFAHLFNLGTSGECCKLAPSVEYTTNRVCAGKAFQVPSRDLLDASRLPGGAFQVVAPATAECGHPERLLVIVTIEDLDLQTEDLHARLLGRDLLTRCSPRGPSFSGPATKDTPKLFRLPLDSWDYGLLEMEVRASSDSIPTATSWTSESLIQERRLKPDAGFWRLTSS